MQGNVIPSHQRFNYLEKPTCLKTSNFSPTTFFLFLTYSLHPLETQPMSLFSQVLFVLQGYHWVWVSSLFHSDFLLQTCS